MKTRSKVLRTDLHRIAECWLPTTITATIRTIRIYVPRANTALSPPRCTACCFFELCAFRCMRRHQKPEPRELAVSVSVQIMPWRAWLHIFKVSRRAATLQPTSYLLLCLPSLPPRTVCHVLFLQPPTTTNGARFYNKNVINLDFLD